MMIGRASLPLVLAATVFAILLGSTDAQACCSQNHRTCVTSVKTIDSCKTKGDGRYVWLPGGAETRTCSRLGNKTACSVHNDCCGTLVCESVASNFRVKQCQHPVSACASYTSDATWCNSKSSCVFQDGKCVPNFDFTIRDLANLPEDLPVDPACCSSDYRTCPTWAPKSQGACAANATKKYVWLPQGDLNATCILRGKSCSVHEDCCGTLVCDGFASDVKKKRCNHPVDLCNTFTDATYCETRSSCDWKDGKCVPNFDWTVFLPENKPENIPDDPGCCSTNHLECSRSAPKTSNQCKTYQNGTAVWIPKGNREVPNATTCVARWKSNECTSHDDCCGSLICAPTSFNVLKLQCKQPLEVCSSVAQSKNFCTNVRGCIWSN
mmetsp:Transcript_26599/g.53143  ORF Transcript_26599/g.53143 Transcript_26599/m.53143 type:complete len:381 (-) Transcript_26599:48-1190(-)